jgi:hypothetical protein
MKTRKYKQSRRRRKTHKHGGKVIGSGGYGCVFRPALRCNGTRKSVSKTISKLNLSLKIVHRVFFIPSNHYFPIDSNHGSANSIKIVVF